MPTTRKHVAISFHKDDLDRLAELQKMLSLDRSKTLVMLIQYGLTTYHDFAEWVKKNATAHNVHCVYTKAFNLVDALVYTLSYDHLPEEWAELCKSFMRSQFETVLKNYWEFNQMQDKNLMSLEW